MPVEYKATVTLDTPQLVRCAHCDTEYLYEMTVTGIGNAETGLFKTESEAEQAAEKDALDNLAFHLNDLDRLFNAIPCPKCLRYQPYMYKALGQSQYDGYGCLGYILGTVGFLAAVGSLITWFASEPNRPTARMVGIVGLAVWAAGYVVIRWTRGLAARYDPNTDDLAGREKRAAERTMTFAAFDDLQAARLQTAYNEHRGASRAAGSSQRAKPWRPDPSAPQARVFEWWVRQSALTNGVTITVPLSLTEAATVTVPEDAETGTVFDLHVGGRAVEGFKVRVSAVYVHKDEIRLE